MNPYSRRSLVVPFLAGAIFACTNPADNVGSPVAPSTEIRSEEMDSAAAERARVIDIGRLVAISLANRPLRHRLKRDLRAAPFREHKLELRSYLRSSDGSDMLARMALASSRPADAILTALDQVRSLELYLPVRAHRATWVGDGELLVAVQLEEDDPITAFNSAGNEVGLNATAAPEQPTLTIVGSETRFDRPLPIGSRNIDDQNGQAVGTLVRGRSHASDLMECFDCLQEDPTGEWSGGSTFVPPGMYLEFSRILDVHEPWTRGDPEIEVHVQGPSDPSNPRVGEDLSCSGEHAYDYRKVFDQDGGFWEGRVMLFSADEVNRFNEKFNDGFHVIYWEDDDTSCVIKLDNEALIELIKSTALASGTVALKVLPASWRVIASIFVATLFANPGDWLQTNDDFVGIVVDQGSAGYDYPGSTHVIMNGTTLNGRATIISR